ncbi:MAG: PEGA domain-containing protein [Treponema sp.]|nr:PEGA domain-containing protein [Treponema sp.]
MFTKKTSTLFVIISALITLNSCVSSTRVVINSKPSNADVYEDGQHVGKTPVSLNISNLVWNSPDITISKDGYTSMPVTLQKEEKITNLVIGYCINIFAFLWCYGPKENQNFVLTPLDE